MEHEIAVFEEEAWNDFRVAHLFETGGARHAAEAGANREISEPDQEINGHSQQEPEFACRKSGKGLESGIHGAGILRAAPAPSNESTASIPSVNMSQPGTANA